MIDLTRIEMLFLSTSTTAVFGYAFAPEHIGFVAALAAGVGVVVGVLAWFDKRIDDKIKQHSIQDDLRHKIVMSEIRGVLRIVAAYGKNHGFSVPDVEMPDE